MKSMKKYHLYLWFIALVGLMTACSQDEAAGPQTYEPTSVTLSASVDRNIQTRAATMPSDCKLRYILEVWTTGENPVLKLRKEELKEDFSGVDFTFNLTDAADYNALLWADFIDPNTTTPIKQTISGFECDHYGDFNFKTTDNLKNIIRTPKGNTSALHKDAFCACHPISKKTGAYSDNVQLVRPFGQINIIEKDADALAKVRRTQAVFNVPKGYNVENGMPTTETEPDMKYVTYPLSGSNHDCTANLFYDYIFAPTTGQTILGEIKLTFTSNDDNLQIGDFTIPANMPVERNKRTNISGHIVSVSDAPNDEAKLSVTISDGWSNDLIEEDADEARVGDFYYSDGTWSTALNAQKTCIGIVFYVNADGKSGKIVGLNEPPANWSGGNDAGKLSWGPAGTKTDAIDKADGLKNMATIKNLSSDFSNYDAFRWVDEQNPSGTDYSAATTGVWYLPSDYELSSLYYIYGGPQGIGKDNFNKKLTDANGTVLSNNSLYISSTESTNDDCTVYLLNNGTGGYSSKTKAFYVRCFRKF